MRLAGSVFLAPVLGRVGWLCVSFFSSGRGPKRTRWRTRSRTARHDRRAPRRQSRRAGAVVSRACDCVPGRSWIAAGGSSAHECQDIERLAQYIVRNPFSIAKMQVNRSGDSILYNHLFANTYCNRTKSYYNNLSKWS